MQRRILDMKKRIRLLALGLCLMLMLSACQGHIPTNETSAPTTAPTQAPTAPPSSAFLDSKQPVEGQKNLFFLPSPAIEELGTCGSCESYPLEDAILLVSYPFDPTGELLTGYTTELTVLSLIDGAVLARRSFRQEDVLVGMTQSNHVIVLNLSENALWVYDRELNPVSQHALPPLESEDAWYDHWSVSPDLTTFYATTFNSGAFSVELATGTVTDLLPGVTYTYLYGKTSDTLFIEYVDQAQLTRWAGVDMNTRALTKLDFPGAGRPKSCVNGQYLLHDPEDYGLCHLVTEHSHVTCYNSYDGFLQIEETGDLMAEIWDEGPQDQIVLYDRNGAFRSSVQVPLNEYTYLYDPPIWLEEYGGFLLITRTNADHCKLYFWDTTIPVPGKDLTLTPYDGSIPVGKSVSQELFDRAKAMSERYGVDIRIADQCQLEYDEYISAPVTDEEELSWALDKLENALSTYPEGLFDQLRYGDIRSIRIELIQQLTRTDWPEDAAFAVFNGFAQEMGDTYLVVVDIYNSDEATYFHEFAHIIDQRLHWDTGHRSDARYSEEYWLVKLQPEGFDYSYSYSELPENIDQWLYSDTPWFLDSYSCTYPTEDRARIMEYAMMGWNWDFQFEPLYDKLDYLSLCIRDCFDTTGWPEVTAWEAPLFQE